MVKLFEAQQVDLEAMLAPEAVEKRRASLKMTPESWCNGQANSAWRLWERHKESLHIWDALSLFALHGVDPCASRDGRRLIEILLRLSVELVGVSHRNPFGADEIAAALGFRIGRGRDVRKRVQSEQLDTAIMTKMHGLRLVANLEGEPVTQADLLRQAAAHYGLKPSRAKEALIRDRNPNRKPVQAAREKERERAANARRSAGAALHRWPQRKPRG